MLTIHRFRGLRSCSAGAVALGACAIAVAAGCSTPTTSTDVWKNPSYASGPVRNVIVFGGRMNETNRRTVEDGFVRALSAHGVHATPSYAVAPGPAPEEPAAQRVVRDGGYDGVLVSSMRGVSERTSIQPGTAYPGTFWGGFYGPGWGSAWEPAYVETDTYVKFETSLWDPRGDGRMIWSDVTQTENPSSTPDFIHSLLKNVIPSMEKAQLLPGPQGAPISSYTP